MGHVNRPEKATEMIHPMQPIIQEIHANHQPEPVPERGAKLKQPVYIKPLKYNQIDQSEGQIHPAVQEHQIKVGKGVAQGIGMGVPVVAQEHFRHNHYHVKRGGD